MLARISNDFYYNTINTENLRQIRSRQATTNNINTQLRRCIGIEVERQRIELPLDARFHRSAIKRQQLHATKRRKIQRGRKGWGGRAHPWRRREVEWHDLLSQWDARTVTSSSRAGRSNWSECSLTN